MSDSPAKQIADVLRAGLPATWRVLPYGTEVTPGSEVWVLCETTELARKGARWDCTVVITVAVGGQDLAVTEPALWDALAQVLAVLNERAESVDTSAVRVVLSNNVNAYQVTLSLALAIGD